MRKLKIEPAEMTMDVYSFLGEVSASEMSTESCSMVFFFQDLDDLLIDRLR